MPGRATRHEALFIPAGLAAVAVASTVHLIAPSLRVWMYLGSGVALAAAPWLTLRWWRPALTNVWQMVGGGIALVLAGDIVRVVAGVDAASGQAASLWAAEALHALGLVAVAAGFVTAIRRTHTDQATDIALDVATLAFGIVVVATPFGVLSAEGPAVFSQAGLNLTHLASIHR